MYRYFVLRVIRTYYDYDILSRKLAQSPDRKLRPLTILPYMLWSYFTLELGAARKHRWEISVDNELRPTHKQITGVYVEVNF